MTLHERDGRYRPKESTVTISPNQDTTDAMRRLLSRTCTKKTATVELGGTIYFSQVYQNSDDPTVAYAETDRDGIPLDAPAVEWNELSERFKQQVFMTCHNSDALTPDTRISLDSSFVPPNFDHIGSDPPSVVSWEGLSDFARVYISGPPGSGKTSCLRRLALEATQQGGKVPLFLQLRSLNSESLTVDGLARIIGSQDGEEQLGELHSPLDGERIILLLDGLDELSSGSLRRGLVDSITDLCRRLPRVRIFVTSREFTPEMQELEDFTHLSIRPASDEWVIHWLRLYFSKQGSLDSANRLIRWLKSDSELRELARSPLLLSLIASLYRRSPRSLNERAELLETCVETLLTGWDSARDVIRWNESRFTPRQLTLILGELSIRLMSEQRNSFTLDDIDASKFSHSQDRAAIVILDSCASSGLLRDAGSDTWAFSHRSIQDYMAASHLVSLTQNSTIALRNRIDEPQVRRALTLSCSLASDPDDLLRSFIAHRHQSSLSTTLLLADTLGQESSASMPVLEECADFVVTAVDRQLRALLRPDGATSFSPGASAEWPDTNQPDWECTLMTRNLPAENINQFVDALKLLRRACFGPAASLVLAGLRRIQSPQTAKVYDGLRKPGTLQVHTFQLEKGFGLTLEVLPESKTK